MYETIGLLLCCVAALFSSPGLRPTPREGYICPFGGTDRRSREEIHPGVTQKSNNHPLMKLLYTFLFFVCCFSLTSQAIFLDKTLTAGFPNTQKNHGISIGDYNNDGHDDVFVSRYREEARNGLYRNNGDGTFTDVSNILGDNSLHTYTALWVDIDNDGLLDLFLGNSWDEANVLYKNNGDGTFADVTEWAGIENSVKPRSINAGDLNGDGYLDIYINNFREENQLFINQGNGQFEDHVEISGTRNQDNAMGVVLFDYDLDEDLDMYLTFDGQPYILFQNDGKANFTDVSQQAGVNYDGNGMGVDIADINQDGLLDIYVTNLDENTLLQGQGGGVYKDISTSAGIQDLGMGWGINFFDYNNDTYPDIYIVNEYGYSPYDNVLYKNLGNDSFQIVSNNTLASRHGAFGSACGDLNDDGRVDLLVANSTHSIQYFQNESNTGHWVKFKLIDQIENRFAIGARVKVYLSNNKILTDQITAGSSYASQSSSTLHFGLGEETAIEKISITWPDGSIEEYSNLVGDEYYLIVKNEGLDFFDHDVYSNLFNKVTSTVTIADAQIKIYPNPAQTNVKLEFLHTSKDDFQISLLNLTGISMPIHSRFNNQTLELDISHLPNGVYFVNIQKGNNFHTEKIVVQH